jgi:glycosyltransferase involved in cell wall biosynthesis
MRVLVATDVHVPLDARIHRRQIGALVAAGVEVTYVAPWSATGTDPSLAGAGVVPVDVPRAVGRRRLEALRAVRRVLVDLGPCHDLVLLHDLDLLAAVAGRIRRRLPPVVWDVHEDTAAALVDRPWVPPLLRYPLQALVWLAERWAERNLHLLLAEDGYRTRFRRAHPVVPNVPYLPSAPVELGDARVLYIGRIARSRGAVEMVELARRLAPDIMVELIGPADHDVRPLIEEACERGQLRWHGFLPNREALALLDGALAGLSLLHDEPNYRVSLPTKVLEYLAYGVPVVATPLPRAAAILRDHHAGLVVGFQDVDRTEAAIRRLAEDADLRHLLGRAGRQSVATRYAWDVEGPRFVEVLRGWRR